MSSSRRRAVFTSLGVITPIGSSLTAFWQALLNGTPGVTAIPAYTSSELPCHIGGIVTDYDPKKFIPATNKNGRKSLRDMARPVHMGLCAAQLAMDDGGPPKGTLDPFRFGVEFGSVMAATELEDFAAAAMKTTTAEPMAIDMAKWGSEGLDVITPTWMLKYLPNMPACHTSIFFDAQGPNNTISCGDVAASLAIGEAYRILQRGLADYFLAGGCDSKVNPLSTARTSMFIPFTKQNQTPATAVKPFDRDRDGMVYGEGAAVFGLEDADMATKRGAKVYAELAGFASGCDHAKSGRVLAGVIRNALRDANITPNEVDHVNAAACGLLGLDAFEARGIAEVFGMSVPVYAIRGQIGNTGPASGAIELAASVLALHHGQLPGTVNHTHTAADCPIHVHTGAPRPITKPYAVKISYTDHGQCAVIIIKKPNAEFDVRNSE
jgi:3-oxoacyl-[acyl-carrier-protein] synthase II